MYTGLSIENGDSDIAIAARSLVDTDLLRFDDFPDAIEADLEPGKALIREHGFFGVRIPKEFGGLGAGVSTYLQVLAELNRAHHLLLPELITANGIGSLPLCSSGTAEQKNSLLPEIASGAIVSAFALTEPTAGSDVNALKTAATKDGDEYVINGEKHYIGHGNRADILTVIARVEGEGEKGITAFLVARDTPGFSVEKMQPNLGGYDIAHLKFEDCRVSESSILGSVGQGFQTAMSTLDEGRLHVAAMCVGMADRAIEVATMYTNERIQFDQPIARFEAVRYMIAESYVDLALVVAHLNRTATNFEVGNASRLDAAVIKYAASEMVVRVADRCLQAMGAAGYLKQYPIERIYRAARVQKIYDGTSEIMRLIIEKEARAAWQR